MSMSSERPDYFLLGKFSDFYLEVADIKQAQARHELADKLKVGDGPSPTTPEDQAARVSGKLLTVLAHQLRDVLAYASPVEVDAYMKARYAMAALADEIFILELAWPGREAWLDNLLEYRLCQSRRAGQRIFELIDELLDSRDRNKLQTDLASVYLLALQLGFKGIHRGPDGKEKLQLVRRKLLDRVQEMGGRADSHACPQAYHHRSRSDLPDQRLAPLSTWVGLGKIAVLLYAVVSSVVWGGLLLPLMKDFGAF